MGGITVEKYASKRENLLPGRENNVMSEGLLIIAILVIFFLFYKNSSLRSEIETRARQQYEVWREKELQTIREQYQEITRKEAVLHIDDDQHALIINCDASLREGEPA